MTIKDLAQRARAINIPDLKRKAVTNKGTLLVELQRKQIRQGVNAKGGILGSYRSDSYSAFKQTLSTYQARPGVPDLYLRGDFHKGIKMQLSGDEYFLDSDDEKSVQLQVKYEGIFGLNPNSLPQAQVNVTNEFNQLVKTQLGL